MQVEHKFDDICLHTWAVINLVNWNGTKFVPLIIWRIFLPNFFQSPHSKILCIVTRWIEFKNDLIEACSYLEHLKVCYIYSTYVQCTFLSFT